MLVVLRQVQERAGLLGIWRFARSGLALLLQRAVLQWHFGMRLAEASKNDEMRYGPHFALIVCVALKSVLFRLTLLDF